MTFERILPVLTLMLGWFLNSFTPIFQARREYRRGVAKGLADLLEIRHRLVTQQVAMHEIKKVWPIPPGEERLIWNELRKMFPPSEDLTKRYDEIVTLIASFDPLLGFQLRSKDFVSRIGQLFGAVEAQGGRALPYITQVEDGLSKLLIPHLDEVILDLSWRHGMLTKFKIKRYISQEVVVPPEANAILCGLKAEIEKSLSHEESVHSKTDPPQLPGSKSL